MKALLIFLLSALTASGADVENAASASRTDVAAAITAVTEGGRVNVPAGTANWTSRITITKSVRIFGAGTNTTTGTVLTGTSGQFKFEPTSDKVFRVSGFQFAPGGFGSQTFANAPVLMETLDTSTNRPLYKFMVDNCFFTNAYSALTAKGCNAWGIFRSNMFINCDIAIQVLGGAPVFKYPIVASTTNALFIEHNRFYQTVEITGVNEQITTGHGVRYVVRFNLFDGRAYTGTSGAPFLPYEHHGAGGFDETSGTEPASDKLRGPPVLEIYGNTMLAHSLYRHMNLRGGSLLVFSNTMTSTLGGQGGINLTEDDSVESHNTTWASGDQINNSHFWSNTWEGVLFTVDDFSYSDGNDETLIQEGRDFFMHAPTINGGKTTWSDWIGSHQATFNSGVEQWHYPYSPLGVHPMISVFNALEGEGGGEPPPATRATISGNVTIGGRVTISGQ